MDQYVRSKVLGATGLAMLAHQHSLVETQAIEQLLVAKGIITATELKAMRDVVFTRSKRVAEMTKDIDKIFEEIQKIDEQLKQKAEFSKIFLRGLDGEHLTDAEKVFLYRSLYPDNTTSDEEDTNND